MTRQPPLQPVTNEYGEHEVTTSPSPEQAEAAYSEAATAQQHAAQALEASYASGGPTLEVLDAYRDAIDTAALALRDLTRARKQAAPSFEQLLADPTTQVGDAVAASVLTYSDIPLASACGCGGRLHKGCRLSARPGQPCCDDGPPGHTRQEHHDASPCYDQACPMEHANGGPFPHPCDSPLDKCPHCGGVVGADDCEDCGWKP